MADPVEGKDVNTATEDGVEDDEFFSPDLDEDPTIQDDHDGGVGSSADDSETHQLDFGDLDEAVKFIDDDEAEASGETEKTDETKSEEDESTETTEGEEGETVPKTEFKKRLDEVIGQRDTEKEANVKLQSQLAELTGTVNTMREMMQRGPAVTREKTPLPLDDLFASGDHQAVTDAMNENPIEFFKSFQERSDIIAKQNLEEQQVMYHHDQLLNQAYNNFADIHEDFLPNVDRLIGVVEQNVGHNIFSAYYEGIAIPTMKESYEGEITTLKAQVLTAKQEGFDEGKKKTIEYIRAKGGTAVLDGSTSVDKTGTTTVDPELQDTEKVEGGVRGYLSRKLIEMRNAS